MRRRTAQASYCTPRRTHRPASPSPTWASARAASPARRSRLEPMCSRWWRRTPAGQAGRMTVRLVVSPPPTPSRPPVTSPPPTPWSPPAASQPAARVTAARSEPARRRSRPRSCPLRPARRAPRRRRRSSRRRARPRPRSTARRSPRERSTRRRRRQAGRRKQEKHTASVEPPIASEPVAVLAATAGVGFVSNLPRFQCGRRQRGPLVARRAGRAARRRLRRPGLRLEPPLRHADRAWILYVRGRSNRPCWSIRAHESQAGGFAAAGPSQPTVAPPPAPARPRRSRPRSCPLRPPRRRRRSSRRRARPLSRLRSGAASAKGARDVRAAKRVAATGETYRERRTAHRLRAGCGPCGHGRGQVREQPATIQCGRRQRGPLVTRRAGHTTRPRLRRPGLRIEPPLRYADGAWILCVRRGGDEPRRSIRAHESQAGGFAAAPIALAVTPSASASVAGDYFRFSN